MGKRKGKGEKKMKMGNVYIIPDVIMESELLYRVRSEMNDLKLEIWVT